MHITRAWWSGLPVSSHRAHHPSLPLSSTVNHCLIVLCHLRLAGSNLMMLSDMVPSHLMWVQVSRDLPPFQFNWFWSKIYYLMFGEMSLGLKRHCCSCKSPGFSSQYPPGSSQPPVTLVPESEVLFCLLHAPGVQVVHIYTRRHSHIHKNKT